MAVVPKYSVGQKVLVRDDLKVGKIYNMVNQPKHSRFIGYIYLDEMERLAGSVVTIKESFGYAYFIEEDGDFVNMWTDEMFECIEENDIKELSSDQFFEIILGGN